MNFALVSIILTTDTGSMIHRYNCNQPEALKIAHVDDCTTGRDCETLQAVFVNILFDNNNNK